MFRKIYIIVALFCAACVAAYANKPVFSNADLTATRIEPGVIVLETSDKTTLYLVEGDSAAVLIDTGTSIADLDKVVARITSKPVRVVATHGHIDHVGNIRFFPEFYMHPADTVIDIPPLKEYRGRILPIADGDRFELGGRTLEVVHTPGHTPGSVTLVDYANHMAFSGDAFGSGQLWMQVPPQVSFATLIESCGRMIEIMAERGVDKLYVGHYPYLKCPLGIDYMIDVDLAARPLTRVMWLRQHGSTTRPNCCVMVPLRLFFFPKWPAFVSLHRSRSCLNSMMCIMARKATPCLRVGIVWWPIFRQTD